MLKSAIFEKIESYQTIIICRHISPDPDAIGSQMGLTHILRETFPYKNIYPVGVYPERLVHMGRMDNISANDYDGALVIVLDTANTARIDSDHHKLADFMIKIDHHPLMESYGDLEWVDDKSGSTSEMIYQFYQEYKDVLKINNAALECLYKGIVADTNRFLYSSTTPQTFSIVSEMLEHGLDITKCYNELYQRPFVEIRLQGYISSNLNLTTNGLAHIFISDDVIKELQTDVASSSNMIGSFNNIEEFVVWVFMTEDLRNKQIRINIRSRGPVINDIAQNYGGGGHHLASGVKMKITDDLELRMKNLILDLDERCKEYLNKY